MDPPFLPALTGTLFLSALAGTLPGLMRRVFRVFNRSLVLLVGAGMVWFGWQSVITGLGSYLIFLAARFHDLRAWGCVVAATARVRASVGCFKSPSGAGHICR